MHEKGKRFSTNIAKGESRNNRETKFHELIMPNRILYSTNIAKNKITEPIFSVNRSQYVG